MVKKTPDTIGPAPENSVGYKNPPKGGQYQPGRSGNPHRKKSAVKSLKEMVMNASGSSVTATNGSGKKRKINYGEALIERKFQRAINGNAKAIKQIGKFCEQYLPEYHEPPIEPAGGSYGSVELTQADVDAWRSQGFLPDDCPYAIQDIDEADLTRAFRAVAAAGASVSIDGGEQD